MALFHHIGWLRHIGIFKILKKVGYNKNIDRICFIIGNHHSPSKIDGLDFQIQWEADLLENLTVMDKEKEQEKIKKCIDENFKTNTGKRIVNIPRS